MEIGQHKPNGKIHTGEEQEKPKRRRRPSGRKKLIHDLLSKLRKRFKSEVPKVTLADFIRLIQLERELEEEEQPREIIITWSEPRAKQNAEK